MTLNNCVDTDMKHISKQEKSWLGTLCDDLCTSHQNSGIDIKHYACIVPHGRSKSCREKGRYWEEQFY
jgi:hypothetical protein